MKKNVLVTKISVLLVLSLFLFGCASTSYVEDIPADKIPGLGESLITVQRANTGKGSIISMIIWIDDEEAVTSIKNGVRSFIIVPNGNYKVQAGSTWIDRGNAVNLSVNNEEIIFLAEPAMGVFSARFKLKETGRRNLTNAQ